MNHLGDTNKMVETPRTDSLLTAILDSDGFVHNGNCPQRWVNHARELERELNAASKERDDALMMLGMYRMKSDEQKQRIKRLEEESESRWLLAQSAVESCAEMSSRIKRLEEALEGTVKWIVHLADSGDAGFWDVEKQSEIIAARAALKKESKP